MKAVGMHGCVVMFVVLVGSAAIAGQSWTLDVEWSGSNAEADDRFGESVALTASHALVGAHFANPGSIPDAGAAYMFVRSDTIWIELVVLTASDKAAYDRFGVAVALTESHALVGAHYANVESVNDAGAAYVFARSGGTWIEQAKLTASNKSAGDFFGYSVSMSGNYSMVGAVLANPNAVTDAGAVYVFSRLGDIWVQHSILFAAQGAAQDQFGVAVAVQGRYALIGANTANVEGVSDAGVVYSFVLFNSTWHEMGSITASGPVMNGFFGWSIALRNEFALIGSQGNAFILSRSGIMWNHHQVLHANGGWLGVAITDRYALVRNKLFELDENSWNLLTTLGETSISSVAMTNKYALIGSSLASHDGLQNAGTAHLYCNIDNFPTTQSQSQSQSQSHSQSDQQADFTIYHRVISVAGSSGKKFGAQLGIYNDFVIISKHDCEVTVSSLHCGRVYVLKKQENSWILVALLRNPGDVYGRAYGRTITSRFGWIFIAAESIADPNEKSYVYSFYINATTGVVQRMPKLVSPISISTSFGRTLASGANFVAVGAPLAAHTDGQQHSGAVVVYQMTGRSNWGKQGSIIQPEGLAENEGFGSSMAMNDEGVLAIGNNCEDELLEAVYVYHLRNRHLYVYQKLQLHGRAGFGRALSFLRNKLYVSAPNDSSSKIGAGSIHIYLENEDRNRFDYLNKVNTQDVEGSHAGSAICVTDSFLLISRSVCDGEACFKQSHVDLYSKQSGQWVFVDRLSNGNASGSDHFGSALACSDHAIAVGAPFSGATTSTGGALHLYTF